MRGLLGSLLPLALGTAFSPLPIVAMIVVLLSRQPGRNGLAFLLGWIAAIVLIIVVTVLIAGSFTVKRPSDPPAWVGVAHLVIGLILLAGAWFTWRRGHRAVRRMAAAGHPHEVVEAAPQLPKWLRSVPNFRPGRCALLGLALCVLNPVDLACIVGAGIELRVTDMSLGGTIVAGICS